MALVFLLGPVLASQTLAIGISETTNGFYLVIAAMHTNSSNLKTNEPIQFDDKLVWMPFCDTNNTELTYGNIAYFVKIRLTDTTGKEVQKTDLGKRFGSKWNQMHNLDDMFKRINDVHPAPVMVGGSFKDNPELGGGRFFPKPCEMFRINTSGVYTLEIQMRMFYPNSKSVNLLHKDILEFSPVKIKVEKP